MTLLNLILSIHICCGLNAVFDGEHFDELRKDTPAEFRPHSLVAFYKNGECEARLQRMKLNQLERDSTMPGRAHLLWAKYNIDEQEDAWYDFIPELMDLPMRFNITRCPEIMIMDRNCPIYYECTKFRKYRRKKDGPLRNWIISKLKYRLQVENMDEVERVVRVEQKFARDQNGEQECHDLVIPPGERASLIATTGDYISGDDTDLKLPEMWDVVNPEYASQTLQIGSKDAWFPPTNDRTLQERSQLYTSRDRTTCTTYVRNHYIPLEIPAFATGTKKMKTPKGLHDGLMDFFHRHKNREPFIEQWADSQTQMNFIETTTRLVYLDWEPRTRDYLANTYLKPLLQEWAGVELELTAFYGIREYKHGAWLRGHVDRIDTHVISATITLSRTENGESEDGATSWPLEIVKLDGSRGKVYTEPGTTILYESAKVIHGRPQIYNGTFHYGAFCHFRPVNWDGKDWLDFAGRANRALNTNMRRCRA